MYTTDDEYTVLLRRARLHGEFMRLRGKMIELAEQVNRNNANYLAMTRSQAALVVAAETDADELDSPPPLH